jgi:peptidoglycan/xylan/chitin deacetylase (PgdA/CDA1 family)
MDAYADVYQPDRSLKGKLRRRLVRLAHRRPLANTPAKPMISFTFDDAPRSAAVTGAALLEARGVHGTFFVSAGLAGVDAPMGRCADADDYRRLAAAGHELGCHSHGHLDLARVKPAQALADAEQNAVAIAAWAGVEPATFAYPYGELDGGAKRALAGRFRLLRAVHPGVIEKGCDLNQAPAVGVEGDYGESLARAWMEEALARRAWLVLYTHDVRDTPSPWGCTPQALERLVEAALSRGFDVVTVADGARRLGL